MQIVFLPFKFLFILTSAGWSITHYKAPVVIRGVVKAVFLLGPHGSQGENPSSQITHFAISLDLVMNAFLTHLTFFGWGSLCRLHNPISILSSALRVLKKAIAFSIWHLENCFEAMPGSSSHCEERKVCNFRDLNSPDKKFKGLSSMASDSSGLGGLGMCNSITFPDKADGRRVGVRVSHWEPLSRSPAYLSLLLGFPVSERHCQLLVLTKHLFLPHFGGKKYSNLAFVFSAEKFKDYSIICHEINASGERSARGSLSVFTFCLTNMIWLVSKFPFFYNQPWLFLLFSSLTVNIQSLTHGKQNLDLRIQACLKHCFWVPVPHRDTHTKPNTKQELDVVVWGGKKGSS